jgi:hypothetical protein
MDDFTQMHVFFVVTTAATILVTAFVCAVLVAGLRFFRTLDRIAGEVEEEAAEIRSDLNDLRAELHKGFRFVPWLSFFGKSAKRIASHKKASRKQPRG